MKSYLVSAKQKITRLEAALLIGLAAAILWCAVGVQMQAALSEKLLRLHVVAHSDSSEDQALKLAVRDQVLLVVTQLTEGADGLHDARTRVEEALPAIQRAAEQVVETAGYSYAVRLSLGETEFPTKQYGAFALPAGRYDALRVILGDGAGQNWWCVLFPPFCTAAALEEEAREAGLSEEEIRFITSDGSYELRFRMLQWLAELRAKLGL